MTSTKLDEVWFTRCPVPTATGIAADRGTLAAEFAPDGITVRSFQEQRDQEQRDQEQRDREQPDREQRNQEQRDQEPRSQEQHDQEQRDQEPRSQEQHDQEQRSQEKDNLDERHFTHAHPTLFREGGNVPALWARSRGADTRLIGLTWIEERQAILVRPGEEAHDLRGRRLALPRHDISIDFWRAMALHGLAGALALSGHTLDDAELVDVPADSRTNGQWEAELTALADGRVDAVYVKGAIAVEAAARHGVVVGIELDEQPDRRTRINNGTPRPITVAQSLLDEHPEIVDRFLAVLLEASDWAAANPDDLARILAAETGSGLTGVAGAYRDDFHLNLHPDLSQERLALLADQEKFLRTHGFLDGPVDVHAWADPEPLRRAHELVKNRAHEPVESLAAVTRHRHTTLEK